MLNELLLVERGTCQTGIQTIKRHPDVAEVGRIPTLLIQLAPGGQVARIQPVPGELKPWTLRTGNHNSFPFVQPKVPLWAIPVSPEHEALRASALDKKGNSRREALLELAGEAAFNLDAYRKWPGTGLLNHLKERRHQLAALEGTDSDVVTACMDYFLAGCIPGVGGCRILAAIAQKVVEEITRSPRDEWLEVAGPLLLGALDKKSNVWKCGAALLFDASGKNFSVLDSKHIEIISEALSGADTESRFAADTCGLTGSRQRLVAGNFPHPNLPVIGPTYVYAKNSDIPAFDRYARFSTEAMPVGSDVAIRLAGALSALTSEDRKNTTWRNIPGEAPKQSDLLLAFVDSVPAAAVAEALAEDEFWKDDQEISSSDDSIAEFEQRTQNMIKLIKAEIGGDVTRTPVRVAVFRKVDPGNRKIVHSDTFTVEAFDQAARSWVKGERNVPPWFVLPIPLKNAAKPRLLRPPHIAPLGLAGFCRSLYIRGGSERQDVTGIPASEALKLFVSASGPSQSGTKRILHLILARRSPLLKSVAHLRHVPGSWGKRNETLRKFNHYEALRTVSLLGIVLERLGREKESYMKETAFKLGQLLAAADAVHAGYCADVRGGDIPPALLGNQVFAMAQTAPVKALATLCRRWKPYDGWAKKTARTPQRIALMIEGKQKDEQQRGWDIRKALRNAREMAPLAVELASEIAGCRVNDGFRAELLLGYLAGLPKKEDSNSRDLTTDSEG